MSSSVISTRAAEPVGSFPHARRVGNLLFLSGIGPRVRGSKEIPGVVLDAEGNVVAKDIVAQCKSVFANVRAILEDAGTTWDRLVDVTVFLTDQNFRTKDSTGKVATVEHKAGDVAWGTPIEHTEQNLSDQPFEAVTVEIKK